MCPAQCRPFFKRHKLLKAFPSRLFEIATVVSIFSPLNLENSFLQECHRGLTFKRRVVVAMFLSLEFSNLRMNVKYILNILGLNYGSF